MTPGVAFFYGGMVKHKNVVATLLQNFICLGLVALCFTFMGCVLAALALDARAAAPA
jgi:Amt family ammonium transporter